VTPQIRKAIILIVSILAALVIGNLVGEQNFFHLAVVVAAVISMFLLPNPALVGFFAVLFFYSGLTAPGIPGKLNFFYLSAMGLSAILFFQIALQRVKKISWGASHTLMVAFGMVLIATILIRGAGFRVLGSGTWGGMFYVQLFLCMLLVVALPQAGIPAKWWPLAILGMALFGTLPLVSDALILMGVSPDIVWRFCVGSQQIGQSMEADVNVQRGVVRYFSAGLAGQLLLVGFLSRVSMNRLLSFRGAWLLPFPMVFLAVTMFGGFRLGILNFFLTALLVAYIQRAFSIARMFLGCVCLVGGWLVLIQVAPYLPGGAQRAVSWVPGTDIPEYIRHDAMGTVDWRLELWREGLKKLPEYWLVGKGYAFSEKEAVAVSGANRATDEITWAIVTSSYHNGPISLLLGLGVFGLLIGLGLMVAIAGRHRRLLKRPWNDPRLKQCHQVVFAMYLVQMTVFLTIYGDVQVSFPAFFFMFAMLEGLRAADQELTKTAPKPEGGK
jgi:hypothetical protein